MRIHPRKAAILKQRKNKGKRQIAPTCCSGGVIYNVTSTSCWL